MKEKVFETKNGVALYFDKNTNKFISTDINAVCTALQEDFDDPVFGYDAINLYHMTLVLGVSAS